MPEKAVVLCVDDEATALFLRKAVLQKFGFAVMTASSASQALAVLSENTVDIVLTDQLMPEVTGTELAAIVKQRYPSMPVVIVSGVNEAPADAHIADLFISKLLGPTVLCERLQEVLQRSRTEQTAG